MAKGNLFQGLARGSIGDVVFYRINGQQVTRVRNRQIKNPKTGSQMAQRCVMSNVSKAYSTLKYICDHSFEGISYGARNMSNFMRLNAAIVRQCAISELENVSWVCRGHNVAPVLPLQVSSGSMPTMCLSGCSLRGPSHLSFIPIIMKDIPVMSPRSTAE